MTGPPRRYLLRGLQNTLGIESVAGLRINGATCVDDTTFGVFVCCTEHCGVVSPHTLIF